MPPVDMLCYFKVQKSDESAFMALMERHWPTLFQAGLTTSDPARVRRCEDKAGNVVIVEEFSWKDESSPGIAHQTPEVMQVWEPMGALTQGKMEFWQATVVPMRYQK